MNRIALLLLGVAALAGCGAPSSPGTTAATESQAASASDEVTYKVEGKGKATVYFQTKSGSTQKDVSLPWSIKDVDASWLSITATRTTGSGKIECVILRGDSEIARTEAEGQYSSCSANGEFGE